MIFKLYRTDHVDWDETRAVVVRAADEPAAREFAAVKLAGLNDGAGDSVWLNPERTACVAVPSRGTSELILVDYKAG